MSIYFSEKSSLHKLITIPIFRWELLLRKTSLFGRQISKSVTGPGIIFWISTIFIIIFFSQNSFAWSGYDFDSNTAVEIGSGNLVREGNIIQIYDWKQDYFYDAEVKSMDSSFGGTRLEVYDFQEKKTHILEMDKNL